MIFCWLGLCSSPREGSESTLMCRVALLVPPDLPLSQLPCSHLAETASPERSEGQARKGGAQEPCKRCRRLGKGKAGEPSRGSRALPRRGCPRATREDLCYWVPSPATSSK